MTHLLPLFTEAFLAEQATLSITAGWRGQWGVMLLSSDSPVQQFEGTRADCERFVVTASARKAFEALDINWCENPDRDHIAGHVPIHWYLSVLAAGAEAVDDPVKTTSGGGA